MYLEKEKISNSGRSKKRICKNKELKMKKLKSISEMLKKEREIKNQHFSQKYYLSENYENIESLMKKSGKSLKIIDKENPEFILMSNIRSSSRFQ